MAAAASACGFSHCALKMNLLSPVVTLRTDSNSRRPADQTQTHQREAAMAAQIMKNGAKLFCLGVAADPPGQIGRQGPGSESVCLPP